MYPVATRMPVAQTAYAREYREYARVAETSRYSCASCAWLGT
jgi:hypothetical protein